MDHWAPAATKGRLDVDVLTLRRARAEGILRAPPGTSWKLDGDAVEVFNEDDGRSRGRFAFMLRIYPDGSSPYDAMFSSADDVRVFIRDMEPRQTRLLVGEGESEELLAATLRGEIH